MEFHTNHYRSTAMHGNRQSQPIAQSGFWQQKHETPGSTTIEIIKPGVMYMFGMDLRAYLYVGYAHKSDVAIKLGFAGCCLTPVSVKCVQKLSGIRHAQQPHPTPPLSGAFTS